MYAICRVFRLDPAVVWEWELEEAMRWIVIKVKYTPKRETPDPALEEVLDEDIDG